jgi:hypothetical protein
LSTINIHFGGKPLETQLMEVEMLTPDKQPTDCALPGRCRPYGTKDFNLVGCSTTMPRRWRWIQVSRGWKFGTFPSQQAPYADPFMPLSRQDKFEMGGVIPDTTVSGLFPLSLRDY